MIKRRAKKAGLPSDICCHTFRATGITAYPENGGTIENAQAIAAHESRRTPKLYDRTSDEIALDEVERISHLKVRNILSRTEVHNEQIQDDGRLSQLAKCHQVPRFQLLDSPHELARWIVARSTD